MAKIKRYTEKDGVYHGELGFICKGCGYRHFITDNESTGHQLCWEFNKDYEKPTINPSILFNRDVPDEYLKEGNMHRCHSFIKDGMIQYLGDCTHQLAGQTIELPDIE
jgi:hypothetical protein